MEWLKRSDKAYAISIEDSEKWDIREILTAPIRSTISYATALHEIGHYLGRYQRRKYRTVTRDGARPTRSRGTTRYPTTSRFRSRLKPTGKWNGLGYKALPSGAVPAICGLRASPLAILVAHRILCVRRTWATIRAKRGVPCVR